MSHPNAVQILDNLRALFTPNNRIHWPCLRRHWAGIGLVLLTATCSTQTQSDQPFNIHSDTGTTLSVTPLAAFNQPWAMTFLPDGQLLVSEKIGRLQLLSIDDSVEPNRVSKVNVAGVPSVRAAGQGGFGDIILHPDFANNQRVYISFVEREDSLSGAAVAMANLVLDTQPRLRNVQTIWRQTPKLAGNGHYAHRLAFSPDGYLYITSGERQAFTPAQDLQQNLGKIIRLHDDGGVPADNPFQQQGAVAAQVWSLGHRNPLGIAFDANGQLWIHEMGPRGGDELNRIRVGGNYGYPLVSNGDHYNGADIPDHHTRPDLDAPEVTWSPVISPSGFVIYNGELIPQWQGSGLIGGLSSMSLVRVSLTDGSPREVERFSMPRRIREVEQGSNGHIYLLEDKADGRLLRLLPP